MGNIWCGRLYLLPSGATTFMTIRSNLTAQNKTLIDRHRNRVTLVIPKYYYHLIFIRGKIMF